MRPVFGLLFPGLALLWACGPTVIGSDAGRDAGAVDAGRDAGDIDSGNSDGGPQPDAGGDGGPLACFPRAVDWSSGDAGCGRAAVVFASPWWQMNPHLTYYAVDVNDRGTVLFAGYEMFPDTGVTRSRISLWRQGVLTPLPELNATGAVVPAGIGPNDEVFGEIQNDGLGDGQKGFVRWPDAGVDLFVLRNDAGWYVPQAVVAFNGRGQFVRQLYGRRQYGLVTGSAITPIPNPSPSGDLAMDVYDLSDDGVVVGGFSTRSNAGTVSPFVWSVDGGFRKDIAEQCPDRGAALRANNAGTLLMICGCQGFAHSPLLYSLADNSVRSTAGFFLPDLLSSDLNDRGWVTATDRLDKHGVLLRNGGRCDIGEMLPRDDEWIVEGAWAINNSGLMLAGGRKPDAGYPTALIVQLDVLPDGGIDPAFAQ